jgi:hypothetical protein
VILYTRNLSECSIDAMHWAIAHELGHVVGLHLMRFGDQEKHEEWADSLAMGWGFGKEWEAWEAWNREVWDRTHPGGQ